MRWAVETLAVQPGDRVLEIGCGSGVAAAMVCAQLVEGRMLAIDRSSIQIERARRRNEPHLASGRLSLETVELADLDVGDARFDKVFAINVNLFWLGPATAELAAARPTMAPGGRLFLAYEAPGPERARQAAARRRPSSTPRVSSKWKRTWEGRDWSPPSPARAREPADGGLRPRRAETTVRIGSLVLRVTGSGRRLIGADSLRPPLGSRRVRQFAEPALHVRGK